MYNRGTGAEGRALQECNSSAAPVPLPGQRTGPALAAVLCSLLVSLAMVPKAKNSLSANPSQGIGKVLNHSRFWQAFGFQGRAAKQARPALFFDAVALALDVEGGRVVQQAIQDGCGHHGVAEAFIMHSL